MSNADIETHAHDLMVMGAVTRAEFPEAMNRFVITFFLPDEQYEIGSVYWADEWLRYFEHYEGKNGV